MNCENTRFPQGGWRAFHVMEGNPELFHSFHKPSFLSLYFSYRKDREIYLIKSIKRVWWCVERGGYVEIGVKISEEVPL